MSRFLACCWPLLVLTPALSASESGDAQAVKMWDAYITAHSDNDPPESLLSYALKVVENIRIALDEGFTTVRDAGRLDTAFAAVGRERRDRRAAHPAVGVVHLADGRSRRPAPALGRR